jgi:hypothetical protein
MYRLAEVSANITDQCVAQGVPFAREWRFCYNRSFAAIPAQRTSMLQGNGQQLLLALML